MEISECVKGVRVLDQRRRTARTLTNALRRQKGKGRNGTSTQPRGELTEGTYAGSVGCAEREHVVKFLARVEACALNKRRSCATIMSSRRK